MGKESGKKGNNYSEPSHPNQVASMNRLSVEAKRLFCEPYEVRLKLVSEIKNKYLDEYIMSEEYKEVEALGLAEKVLSYVSTNAYIQAQAIVYSMFPVYNSSGEEASIGFGYENGACPHLNVYADIRAWVAMVYKEGLSLSSPQVNLPGVVKKWMGYPGHSGIEKLPVQKDDFL